MGFENFDATAFYVITIFENQAPARQLFTKFRAQNFPWLATPTGRGYNGTRNSATGVGEMWLCLGVLLLRSWPINWVDLDSDIKNPTSLRTFFARELQTPNKTKAGPESKNLHTTHARPNRHDCRESSKSHLPPVCICFAPYITGVLVLDLT